MRAPGFWSNPVDRPGWKARALAPLGALYAAGTARRLRRGRPWRAEVPVICVGNLTAGGAGKTPLVMWLQQWLCAAGHRPHVLSRGYGGTLDGPLRVDPRQHDATMVGDEPLMLAALGPVWVGRDRALSARAAQQAGADVLILDDGFQNPSLAKDLSIVVVDATRGFGNGRCIPAGPLREPVATGLGRADLVLSLGDARAQARFDETWGHGLRRPRAVGAVRPLPTGMDWSGMPVFAFAGIAYPQKFFETLGNLGCTLRGAVALEDHQPLSPDLIARLKADADARGAQLVTTEKDAVRLAPDLRADILILPVRLEMSDPAPLCDALAQIGLGHGATEPDHVKP